MDCLPKGGTITVIENNGEIIVRAEGENAAPREKTLPALALEEDPEIRQPKFIHAYLCGLLAKHYGFTLTLHESGEGFISFVIKHTGIV